MRYRIESLTSEQIEQATVAEIAEFFRFIFNNAFGQYLLNPRTGEAVPPARVFEGLHPGDYLSQAQLDEPPLKRVEGPDDWPDPVFLLDDEEVIFWQHPQATFEAFSRKLQRRAQIVLLRDRENDDEIVGLTFGRRCSFEENWQTEEWRHPYYYSGLRDPHQMRPIESFLEAMNRCRFELPTASGRAPPAFTPGTEVYAWNCIAIDPRAQGQGLTRRLTAALFEAVPREAVETLYTLGETQVKALSYRLFTAAGAVGIPGVLQEHEGLPQGDDLILLFARLSRYADYFSRST